MRWTKEMLEKVAKEAYNKTDMLIRLGRTKSSYETLNKYLKKYNIDCSHFKFRCTSTSIENKNPLKIYSKGDKHPYKDLYFWQYRYNRLGTKSFEVWYCKADYAKADEAHKINNAKYRSKNILGHLVRTSLARENIKPRHLLNEELIDEIFIKELWEKQDGLCYWFNIPMKLIIQQGQHTDLLRVSIDRVDSSKGYTKNNVVLCCHFANRGKGSAMLSDWLNLIKTISENIKK